MLHAPFNHRAAMWQPRSRARARRQPLRAGLLVPLILLASCRRPTPYTQPPALAVVTNLEGTTEPCGCTSRPLGGLDRLAQTLFAWRQHAAVALVFVGDTFFTEPNPAPQMRRHEEDKARAIADIVARLQPAVMALGPGDGGSLWPTLADLPPQRRDALHLERTAQRDAAAPAFTHTRLMLTEQPVVLLTALMPPPDDTAGQASYAAALQQYAAGARSETKATVPFPLVLLWPHGVQAARTVLGELAGVDVIIAGGTSALLREADTTEAPEPVGQAILVQAGARGERLGHLQVHRGTAIGPWQYFDGGRAQSAQLTDRAAALEQAAGALPEGPGRQARLQRAKALRAEAAGVATSPPATPHVTWELQDIDASQAPAPWATQALAAFNESLCASARADTARRTCKPAPTPADAYVGTEACRACHAQAFAVYEKTAHARAWATLTQAGKACDLSCVGCHVVGFEQPGGFCHLADAPKWANVGCESCHGPGAGHVASPGDRAGWSKHFVANTPETVCVSCHNQEHSDQFNFATYRPRVLGPGHGQPLEPAAAP